MKRFLAGFLIWGILSAALPANLSWAGALKTQTSPEIYAAFSGANFYEYQFPDQTRIKVHFKEEILNQSGETAGFAREVLDAAVSAYQTITQFQGFSTPGYSFASPDKNYAYDADQTIDIYLGDPRHKTIKDSPCFDTIQVSPTQFEAVIFLPSNYREFIKNWERLNPSGLGKRNVGIDLRGTLIHEMLHALLFYYNKNLKVGNPDPENSQDADWYVEGLARYFEIFAGARHDFFSQGFKHTLEDKIRFSRGGCNYFLRYPDQTFTRLRYENALFWRFIDTRYGMSAIERLSRDLRNTKKEHFSLVLEKVTGQPFEKILKQFSAAILFKDFGLKEDTAYLKDVARTHLVYRNKNLYLQHGRGGQRKLGKACHTDWIGHWDDQFGPWKGALVAGDDTPQSDVRGWATDFYQIDIDGSPQALPWLGVCHENGGEGLIVQIFVLSKGGSLISKATGEISRFETRGISLKELLKKQGLSSGDAAQIFLLVTNKDPEAISNYHILIS
jgi:hypothetical protein